MLGRRTEHRIVEIDGHGFDVPPAEHMLVINNDDRPGVIGSIGMIIGDAELNISDMDVGRVPESDRAVMLLATTEEVPAAVLDELRAAPGILSVDALQG